MKSQSLNLENIYLDSVGIIVSKMEKEGPLGNYFNHFIDDYYFNCKSFEKAQIKLASQAIKSVLAKSIYNIEDIKIAIGGDLSNQIFASTAAIKEQCFPYCGVFAACASGVLAIILASIYMISSKNNNALVYTSSHQCVSERQYRYPNEYGVLLKDTNSKTITGACALILSNEKRIVKISKATIGKIIDINSSNVNDMGTIMAYAAINTYNTHLINNNETINDYDLIVTGDLGEYGSKVFIEELEKENENIKNKHFDCGYAIYDKKTQNTNSGGSGPACVMCVTFSYIISQMKKQIYKKVLVIATGALHSQISFQQKESIPCIAHAIVLEVN